MTNTLTVIRNAAAATLGAPAPAKVPVGDLIANSRTGQDRTAEAVDASIGIWESSPGVFRRHLTKREFSHIVADWCIFTPEGGDPIQ